MEHDGEYIAAQSVVLCAGSVLEPACFCCRAGRSGRAGGAGEDQPGRSGDRAGGAEAAGSGGVQVFEKDKLRTGADGALGVTLQDNTLLSAGPNS